MRRQVSRLLAVGSAAVLAAVVANVPAGADQQTSSAQRGQKQQSNEANAAGQPAKVDVKDLSSHPDRYLNKTVTVEGDATDVLGPHLFVVDDHKLFHLWGGMVVYVPEPFAAVIRRDSPVRITGTVKQGVLAEAKRKWAFLGNDPTVEVDLSEKPVIVASEVTTVAPAVVSLRIGPGQPVGTSGANGSPSDLSAIARASDATLVGRRIDATGVVARTDKDGFWVRDASGNEVLVVPAKNTTVRQGQSVEVRGTVLETPRNADARSTSGKNPPVYIYADEVVPK